jgi:hypothetical protein
MTRLSALLRFVDEIGSGLKLEMLGTYTTAVALSPRTLVAAKFMLFCALLGPT